MNYKTLLAEIIKRSKQTNINNYEISSVRLLFKYFRSSLHYNNLLLGFVQLVTPPPGGLETLAVRNRNQQTAAAKVTA